MNKIYLISDMHLGHSNIIKYCNRPFRNIDEMNDKLINNWNSTVTKNDIVYFLGDLCMRSNPDYWLHQLNGNKILVRGNHDKSMKNVPKYLTITHNNENILLIHNPESIEFDWNGWIIHGHHHNNRPFGFPLIHNKKRTINVSAEMINYTPIELNHILSMRKL